MRTMFLQLELAMLPKHVHVEAFSPAHDGHWVTLQALQSTFLQAAAHKWQRVWQPCDAPTPPCIRANFPALTPDMEHLLVQRPVNTLLVCTPGWVQAAACLRLTCMMRLVKTVLWSTTTVPPPVKRLITCSCCFWAC